MRWELGGNYVFRGFIKRSKRIRAICDRSWIESGTFTKKFTIAPGNIKLHRLSVLQDNICSCDSSPPRRLPSASSSSPTAVSHRTGEEDEDTPSLLLTSCKQQSPAPHCGTVLLQFTCCRQEERKFATNP